MRAMPVAGGTDRFGERRVSYNGVEQTVQAHEGCFRPVPGVVVRGDDRRESA